jgi:hypothetical protein
MNKHIFEELLQGKQPSLNDFASFVSICEKLPVDILWYITNSYPNINFILHNVLYKNLENKIQRENIDAALNEIVTKYKLASQNKDA